MAQGNLIFKASQKSGGSQKKKAFNAKRRNVGRRTFVAKGRKAENFRREFEATKSINKKNEAVVSSKAVASGVSFFLSDIMEGGKKEMILQKKAKENKNDKSCRIEKRLKVRLEES